MIYFKMIDKKKYVYAIFSFLISFIVYLKTLAPTVYWADSGELIIGAYTLGILHPSGYPTYTVLSHLFTYLPFGTVAFRVNLMSAFFAALTVLLVFWICYKLTKSNLASFLVSLFLAFSSVFWSQAVIAEVYTLHAFFMALNLLILLHWKETNGNKWIYLFCFTYGLSLTHHITSIFFIPGFLYFILFKKDFNLNRSIVRFKNILIGIVLFILGLIPYLYLIIRSKMDPVLDFGNPENLSNFLYHVTGKQYSFVMFEPNWSIFSSIDLIGWLSLFLLLILAIYGFYNIRRRDIKITFLLILFVNIVFNFFYNIPDIFPYFIPSIIILVIFSAIGLKKLLSLELRHFFLIFIVLISLFVFIDNYQENNLSDFWLPEVHGNNVFDTIQEDDAILINDDNALLQVLWYLKIVEGKGRDIRVIHKGLLPLTWYQKQIEEEFLELEFSDFTVEGIIEDNIDKAIYFVSPQENLSYDVEKVGILYKLDDEFDVEYDYSELLGYYDPYLDKYVIVLNEIGIEYYEEELFEEAIETFELAIQIKFDSFDSWTNLALVYYETGDVENAINALEIALDIEYDEQIAQNLELLKDNL